MRFETTNVNGERISVYMDTFLGEIIKLAVTTAAKTKDDRRFLFCGETGAGKTTIKANIAKYMSELTGREYNVSNIYFDTNEYVTADVSTEKKILDYDEAAVGLLASDWATSDQKLLMKAAMMDRKKQHFHLMAMPAFEKLKDYIALDRSIGLIYCYKQSGFKIGHFLYYNKKSKEFLYKDWKKTGIMKYHKYYTFRGTFPNNLYDLIDEKTYEAKKDKAILNLVKEKVIKQSPLELRYFKVMEKLLLLPKKLGITQKQLIDGLEIPESTFFDWRKELKSTTSAKENEVLALPTALQLVNVIGESKTALPIGEVAT